MIVFILAAVCTVGLGMLWLSSRDDVPMETRINLLRVNYLILLCAFIIILTAEGIYDY